MAAGRLVVVLGLVLFGTGCGDEVLGTFDDTESGASTSATATDGGSGSTGEPPIPVVGVGEDGRHTLSLDMGQTWEVSAALPPDPDKRLSSVIWGESFFLAVGGDARGRIERSVDGVDWEVVLDDDQGWFGDVTWNGSRYVAVGGAGRVAWSEDGTNWNLTSAPVTGIGLRAVAANGAVVVAVGPGNVAVSYDGGESWTLKADDGRPYAGVAFGGRFVAVDKDGGAFVAFEDATPWAEEQTLDTVLYSVLYTRGNYWAGSDTAVYQSVDGIAWTQHDTGVQVAAMAEGGGLGFVGVGWENRYWSSDGQTWEMAGWYDGEPLSSVAVGID